MRLVFMGTPEFARRPLACLAESEHEVLAVVTGPHEPMKRGGRLRPTAVHDEATRLGLSVLTAASLKDKALHRQLKALDPDLFVVVAFKILPRKLFTLPRRGSINIHASLLPKYRGAAPITWALINGEKETGLSSFVLKERVDTGDLILQERVAIADDDTYDSLSARLSEQSGPFLLRTLAALEDENFVPLPQDHSQATPAPKITVEDAMIDFGLPAENVRNFVRALSTVPAAYTFFRGTRVKIYQCAIAPPDIAESGDNTRPGSIFRAKKRLLVQCARSAIEVLTLMPQGKKKMDGLSFLNGYRPAEGECFGDGPQKN